MTTPIEKIGLSPPALGALRKAKVRTLEAAAAKSNKELLAIPRFGKGSIPIVRRAARAAGISYIDEPDGGPTLEMDLNVVRKEALSSLPPGRSLRDFGINVDAVPARIAEAILMKLLERMAPSTALVTLAWELALAFDQDRGRGALIHDGMRASYNGQPCILRTAFKAGEAEPPAAAIVAKALLVKADE